MSTDEEKAPLLYEDIKESYSYTNVETSYENYRSKYGVADIDVGVKNGYKHQGIEKSKKFHNDTVSKNKDIFYPELTRIQKILVFLSSTYFVFSSSGFVFGFGNIYADMIQTLEVSRTEASLVQSLVRATSMGGGFIAGPLIKRYGDTRCIVIGSLMSCFGLVISSFLTDIIAISVFTGVVTGAGLAFIMLTSYTTVSALFRHDPALGLNLVSIGVGVGMMVFPIATEAMIELGNWNGALLISAGLLCNNLVGCAIYYIFIDKWKSKVSDSVSKKPQVCDVQLIQNPYYVVLIPCSFLIGISIQVETLFLVDHVVSLGFDLETGAYLLTITGVAGLICRVIEGIMFKLIKSKSVNHLTFCMFILLCGHLMFAFLEDYWSLFGGVILIGIGQSIYGALMSPLTVDIIGVSLLPVGYGILNSLNGIGNAISGIIGGFIFDLTGSYTIIFLSAAAGTFVVFIVYIILLFKMRTYKQYEQIIEE